MLGIVLNHMYKVNRIRSEHIHVDGLDPGKKNKLICLMVIPATNSLQHSIDDYILFSLNKIFYDSAIGQGIHSN